MKSHEINKKTVELCPKIEEYIRIYFIFYIFYVGEYPVLLVPAGSRYRYVVVFFVYVAPVDILYVV